MEAGFTLMPMTISTTQKRAIPPGARVRYIKLGTGGKWEKECIEKGIIHFGFHPGAGRRNRNAERFRFCMERQWDDLKRSYIEEGRSKGTATSFTNQTRLVFENEPETLWITFMGERLYWGRLESSPPKPHPEDGVCRSIAGGWQGTDLNGETLTKDRLSGALTKLAAFQGTSCNVDVADYVIRRIKGKKIPEVELAVAAFKEMKSAVLGMMRLLDPADFEILVDLVFSTSGWRRQGIVGKAQKTKDFDLILPSTGERAFVQVKSKTTSARLAEYIDRIDQLGPYDRMFYIYHSGEAETDDNRVIVVGPEKLAELVMDAGLGNWLMRKVS
jgi:hypothetical protein